MANPKVAVQCRISVTAPVLYGEAVVGHLSAQWSRSFMANPTVAVKCRIFGPVEPVASANPTDAVKCRIFGCTSRLGEPVLNGEPPKALLVGRCVGWRHLRRAVLRLDSGYPRRRLGRAGTWPCARISSRGWCFSVARCFLLVAWLGRPRHRSESSWSRSHHAEHRRKTEVRR